MSGAHVVAVASEPFAADLQCTGARTVVQSPSELDESVHFALDVVGGQTLSEVCELLDDQGAVISIGDASHEELRIPVSTMLGREREITGFFLFADTRAIATDLALLAALVPDQRLRPHITSRGPWQHYDQVVSRLLGRQLHGTAKLSWNSRRARADFWRLRFWSSSSVVTPAG
jgi:NADPH:quinone reductase-like Zn-dependent oxidoreductase